MARAPSPSFLLLLRACIDEKPFAHARCSRLPRAGRRSSRGLSTTSRTSEHIVPLRKQLKEETKTQKRSQKLASSNKGLSVIPAELLAQFELTVGLEIHAELSTARKLFSTAATSLSASPNQHVADFDAATPGAQPCFQLSTLLPALRAALALGCEIQHKSGWDRKHYFWWDQPQGYQITQYYDPFAVNGSVTLTPSYDGVPHATAIGIKQIQMEQDTAKTVLQPPHTHLVDFNRVSHPLIEIITLPHIHDPNTAAAFVRRVQRTLKAVGACETGMEMGGLRVDVNVSVKEKTAEDRGQARFSYAGVTGLGQRTEIKNLSSLTGISTAIALERDRQISILTAGGTIEGETRGWTLGATSTHRIRGKEGEVDYRYMPDPDLAPLLISSDLLSRLSDTLPEVPEATIERLVTDWGVNGKDARTLVDLDDGDRCELFFDVGETILLRTGGDDKTKHKIGKMTANWVIHELGALLAVSEKSFSASLLSPDQLASTLMLLDRQEITLPTAKRLLKVIVDEELPSASNSTDRIEAYIDAQNLRLQAMTDEDYLRLAEKLVQDNAKMADQARSEALLRSHDNASESEGDRHGGRKKKLGSGKMMWFVGQMVRHGEAGRVQPERAEYAVKRTLGVAS